MEIKEYRFSYPPKVYTKYRHVVYVEDKWNESINDFLKYHYNYVKRVFRHFDLEFHYLPDDIGRDYSIIEAISSAGDGTVEVRDVAKAANSELLRYFNDDDRHSAITPSLFFCDRKRQGNKSDTIVLKALPIDQASYLGGQIFTLAYDIGSIYPTRKGRPSSGGSGFSYSGSLDDDLLGNLAIDMEADIVKAVENGIPDKDILDVVKRIILRVNKSDRIIIRKNYRIYIDEENKKEVKMAALPKALYLFLLKHPEGINRNELFRYMPEITYIYLKVRTRRVSHPLDTVRRMVVGDQLSNNLKSIRDAFQKDCKMVRNSMYSIEPDAKNPELYKIGIREEGRTWQCPDISNKKIPMLPQKVLDMERATWKILHELNDPMIDKAIGYKPPKSEDNTKSELDIF